MQTKLQMALNSRLRPTLDPELRAAYRRYEEVHSAYEQARNLWENAPTKYATEWVDVGESVVRWRVVSVSPVRRF